jgi:hypothetical protein
VQLLTMLAPRLMPLLESETDAQACHR